MTLKQKIKKAISEGISAEETETEITERVMTILAQETEELEVHDHAQD